MSQYLPPLYLSVMGLLGNLGYAVCYVLCCIFPNGMDTPPPWFSVVLGWERSPINGKYTPKDFETQFFFQF